MNKQSKLRRNNSKGASANNQENESMNVWQMMEQANSQRKAERRSEVLSSTWLMTVRYGVLLTAMALLILPEWRIYRESMKPLPPLIIQSVHIPPDLYSLKDLDLIKIPTKNITYKKKFILTTRNLGSCMGGFADYSKDRIKLQGVALAAIEAGSNTE